MPLPKLQLIKMEKQLTRHISYLPEESIEIYAVGRHWQQWYTWAILVGVFAFINLAAFLGANSGFLFFFVFFGGAIGLFMNSSGAVSKYIKFTKRRVAIRQNGKEGTEDQEISHVLKSPTYLDVIVKQKPKALMEITFEQYGEKMGKTTISGEDLTYLLDSLNDLLGLEIKESRSTAEKEDILYLRPVDSDENLMPSYLKIVDNPMRLIVNPTSNSSNFMINYQRNIIKNAAGFTYNLDDIRSMKFDIYDKYIVIMAWSISKNTNIKIIEFKAKSYSDDVIQKDLQLFVDFLKTKDCLQHIQFDI